MAIVKNFWLKGSKKRLGGAVLYEAMGQTRARELASSVSNPRTEAQMSQRIKWSNLVNFYRANSSWMKYAFESKKANQSEYNAFMSRNVTGSNIYLTKSEAANGACVVGSYTMTQGSLPSISYSLRDARITTNIFLPAEFAFSPNSSVGDFSRAVIQANPAIREGDQLSIIRYTQMMNDTYNTPYVIVRKYEIIMNTQSTAQVQDYWPSDILEALSGAEAFPLTFKTTGNAGGFLMILSRTTSGKTYVSTQSILPVDNGATIQLYSSQTQYQAAIDSYGTSEEVFLSSDYAQTAQSQAIALAILNMTFLTRTFGPGAQVPSGSQVSDQPMTLNFNNFITQRTVSAVVLRFSSGLSAAANNITKDGSSLNFMVPALEQTFDDAHILRIVVTLDAQDYVINFAPDNAYREGGLE